MMRGSFVATSLIFGTSVPIAAGPIDDAWAVYESVEYETGAQLMRPFTEHDLVTHNETAAGVHSDVGAVRRAMDAAGPSRPTTSSPTTRPRPLPTG